MQGVLVASDAKLEWLLPWWWENYSRDNILPVAFVDFGMSNEKKTWCKERGLLIAVEAPPLKEVDEVTMREWALSYGESYFEVRKAWFKKPAACLASPFQETIWLDLDCEVLRDISALFSFLSQGKEVGAVLERIEDGGEILYNGGVIVFRKGSVVLEEWAELSSLDSDLYWGDDRILSKVIKQHGNIFSVVPDHYNWRLSCGIPSFATIIHWNGEWGKVCIAKEGGYRALVERLSQGRIDRLVGEDVE